MFLHAKALEIFSQVYQDLAKIDFEKEFPNAEKEELRKCLRDQGLLAQLPTGKEAFAAR